ncbi:hypothetical protein F5Y10DRAFT_275404 [Nemania abortiva]|nr:hypothetical protein F5Y10DRAFT_275404 [Nemania abortiva]
MSLDQLHNLPEAAQQAILNGPALAPPPGIIPNLDHPPNQNALGLAVTTISTYAKLHGGKKPHYEHTFVLASYGLIVGVAYCIYEACTSVGGFVHQWDVRVRDLAHFFYIVHVGAILYSVAIMLLKIAILLQWVRLFVPRGTKGLFYLTSHSFLWINVLLYSVIVITICASCKPFAKLWDSTLPGKCSANREIIDIATAVGNLASDLVILVLPQPVIWKLKIKTQKKIGITFVFCIGIFAIISAAFRVYASVHFFKSKDKTFTVASVALWGIAELTCGILIYCIPTIPRIFKDSRLSLKSFIALVPWVKSPLVQIRSWTYSRQPSFRSEKLPLDSLCDPSYDDNTMSRRRGPEKAQLENQNSQAYGTDIQQPQPSWNQCIV